ALVAIPLVILLTWLGVKLLRPSPYEPKAEAKFFYDQGLSGLHAGTYFQASKALKQAVASDDQYPSAHARLAEAYLEINNTEQAKNELLLAQGLLTRRTMTAIDKLYLDAINATATRDFPAAIAAYQALVNQAPAAEKANAYSDLGRAFERNEQVEKAIENYTQATKLDSQSAGAFLRLGVAFSRRRDAAASDLEFKRA